MMRTISACVLAVSISAIGCAAPGGDDESGGDQTASSSDEIRYCGEGQICDPVGPATVARPDLRVEIVNPDTYCGGTIQFRVRNVGTAPAAASKVASAARDNTTVLFSVPSLPAGGTSAVFSRTFRPTPGDVGLSVTADATRLVVESNESNNVAYGYCLT